MCCYNDYYNKSRNNRLKYIKQQKFLLKMKKLYDVNKLKYLLKIKIPIWRISILSHCHTPYRLLKIKSVALLFKQKRRRVFQILKCIPMLKFYSPFNYFSVLFKCRYEGKWYKREWVTKYKCLECFIFVCNIYSKFRKSS